MNTPPSPPGPVPKIAFSAENHPSSLLVSRTNQLALDEDPLDLGHVITQDDIKGVRQIGRGGFGDVFVLEHVTLGQLALKKILEDRDEERSQTLRRRARREAKTWMRLDHPNILSFTGIIESPDAFYFVCPFQKNGSVAAYIRSHPEANRLDMIGECAAGLAYLHKCKIIHGDIKAANVLVSDDLHMLICDFGLSRPLTSETSKDMKGAGSWRWMSPELFEEGASKSFASDTWAFGMMSYEILSGLLPYHEITINTALLRAIVFEKRLPPQSPTHASDGASYSCAWDSMTDCWDEDPERRLSMEHIHDRIVNRRVSMIRSPRRESTRSTPTTADTPVAPLITNRTLAGTALRNVLNLFRRRSRVLKGHTDYVRSVAFSPDNRTVASASDDRTVCLWDAALGERSGEPMQPGSQVNCVAFAPDGATLASGCDDNSLHLWDVATRQPKGDPLQGHTWLVWSVAFAPDGRSIASGSRDNMIRLWDAATGSCLAVLEGHTNDVNSVTFSPDGRTLASGSWDRTVRLWNVSTAAQIGWPLEVHTWAVLSVVFSPDGSTLFSGSGDRTIWMWDVESRQPKGDPLVGHTGMVRSVAISPDGRILASGSEDKTIRLWDLASSPPRTVQVLEGHSNFVASVAFSSNGKWLASGSWDYTIRLWDIDVILGRT